MIRGDKLRNKYCSESTRGVYTVHNVIAIGNTAIQRDTCQPSITL